MFNNTTEARLAIAAKIDGFNDAIKNGNTQNLGALETGLKDAEREYAQLAELEFIFGALSSVPEDVPVEQRPMRALWNAMYVFEYTVLSHKVETSMLTGAPISCEMTEKTKQLNLLTACKALNISTMWTYKVEKLGELLAIRLATELKLPEAEILRISSSMRMSRKAKECYAGESAASNTQLCKLIQSVVDDVVFVPKDDDAEMNKVHVLNRDAQYMVLTFLKKGKAACSLACAGKGQVINTVANIIHRLVTGKMYTLEYKVSK